MILQELTMEDLTEIAAWSDDENISKWIGIDDWHEYYNAVKDNSRYFLFGLLENDELIGELSAEMTDDVLAISLIIKPMFQGKGFGIEALKILYQNVYKLTKFKPSYIHAAIESTNTHSIKCYEKAGLTHIRLDRQVKHTENRKRGVCLQNGKSI